VVDLDVSGGGERGAGMACKSGRHGRFILG
jgi:hypothetical protein